MTPYAEPGPLYGIVWPILISVAVTPGVSLDVPAPPRRPRPADTESAATAMVPSPDLLFDMVPSCNAHCTALRKRARSIIAASGDARVTSGRTLPDARCQLV